jgi:hypothetical protein
MQLAQRVPECDPTDSVKTAFGTGGHRCMTIALRRARHLLYSVVAQFESESRTEIKIKPTASVGSSEGRAGIGNPR